jgi:diacylglycerol kinase (ATP)
VSTTPAPVPDSTTPAKPIAVLVNPGAGRGRRTGLFPEILRRLGAAGHEVSVLDAPDRAAALAQAQRAVTDGAAALVAVGGDGTVHLALQAVAGTSTPFGLVPCGTGNDFADAVGVDRDPLVAADAVSAALAAGRTRALDLARISVADGTSLWFGAVLGAGFDAIVNERANRMRFPKGPRRYDVAIFAELMRLRPRQYTISLDGAEQRLPAVLVAVGNTPSYGGGMRICPAADPTDGLLDIVVGGQMSRRLFLSMRPKVYAGTHVDHPLVQHFRARTVTIDAEGITAYADGERALPLPITITAVPGALTLAA